MKTKAMVDGRTVDVEVIPWNNPTGSEVKDLVATNVGYVPPGAVCIADREGKLRHVAANEPANLRDGERITFTPSFETAFEDH